MPPNLRLLTALLALAAIPAVFSAELRFPFGSASGRIDATQTYDAARGYGFEPGATLTATPDAVTSTAPFYFSAAVPTEGNYRVTVTFPPGTDATVKAELRRLMVEHVVVPAGQPAVTRTFLVNTRAPPRPAAPAPGAARGPGGGRGNRGRSRRTRRDWRWPRRV